jgi:hypothetical protein
VRPEAAGRGPRVLLLVLDTQSEQLAPTKVLRPAAQVDLVLLPSAVRHHETCAERDPALHLKFIKTEPSDDTVRRRQKGGPAGVAILASADRRHIEDAERAVSDDPFLVGRHAVHLHAGPEAARPVSLCESVRASWTVPVYACLRPSRRALRRSDRTLATPFREPGLFAWVSVNSYRLRKAGA